MQRVGLGQLALHTLAFIREAFIQLCQAVKVAVCILLRVARRLCRVFNVLADNLHGGEEGGGGA